MLDGIQKVHLIGAGGIGMSAVAKFLLAKEKDVSGSDVAVSDIVKDLEKRGVNMHSGHAPENIADGTNLVIFSSAVPEDNLERTHARELGIPEMSYFAFLGALSKEYSTIVVTGTNGKSTTTALLGLILQEAGYDPMVIVGSLVPGFKEGNLRLGGGRFFVVEGCEHNANMLHLEPEMIVLTNIEEDHLDFYRDLDHIRETFQLFVEKLKGKGLTILNADDAESQKIVADRSVRFGTDAKANYRGSDRKTAQGVQSFELHSSMEEEKVFGVVDMKVPGAFNMMNALAATAAAMELGVPFDVCKKVLESFTGTWRRFERVGVWHGADIISDYGHHPTAIRGTIEAAREFFPGRRIVLCFEPHQHSRTKELIDQFIDVLPLADHIIVSEIYDVAGRQESKEDVSSKMLVDAIKENDPGKDVQYAEDLDKAETKLRALIKANDVVLVMGAGDVDEIARNLAG